jgi:hypothetical protein
VQGLNDKGTRDSRIDQSRRSTEGHVASDPAYRRSEFRGFDHKETCTVDPRSAKSRRERGKVGPQDLVGNRCQGVGPHREMPTGGVRSEFRGSGFCVA